MYTTLVVDDSPIELLVSKTLLEKLGFSPFTATSGEEALSLIREHSPHVVICDISMPGMSGLDLLKATRDFVRPPIFIMATGLDDADHAVKSIRQGAYGYLTKPLKEEPIRQALHEATLRHNIDLNTKQEHENLKRNDPLTGLFNKEEFTHKLAAYVESLHKDDHPMAVLFINIDGLRFVNNTYGHHEGDRVLQIVSAILRRSVRPGDIVARYGGDIFAIALLDVDPNFMDAKARFVSKNVEQTRILLGDREHSLSVTIGIAIGQPHLGLGALINNADLALALAKENGSNQIYLYSDGDEAHRKNFGTLFDNLETLKQSIQARRFSMHYQPIVDLHTGKPSHFEALIRLRDEKENILPPDVFIRVAEKFGLATKVDCMVVSTCIRKLAELSHAGNPAGLSINLSGKSLGDIELLALIKHELAATGVDPSLILFEITETAAFQNFFLVQKFVSEVKKLGCRFALDDFGVGYSSFYFIKQLEIDYLKIDGTFIRNLLKGSNDKVFVQAMIEISRVYGMKVIAEWVENAEVITMLKNMGVGYGQGYHFGRPTPECEMKQPKSKP